MHYTTRAAKLQINLRSDGVCWFGKRSDDVDLTHRQEQEFVRRGCSFAYELMARWHQIRELVKKCFAMSTKALL